MNVIELSQVSKTYGRGENEFYALKDVSLSVPKGQFVAIMGPSGSGKSTLMNIIGLLDVQSRGDYLLDGDKVGRRRDNQLAKLRRQKIGFIFQTFNLLPRLGVLQNVELPMIYSGLGKSKRLARAKQILGQVGLGDKLKSRPNQLSGGQIQRVAVARALANQPSLILADEPTGNLDTKSSESIMQLLASLHESGATIIMVTHNPELARYADRTVHLRDGQIQGQMTAVKRRRL